jgi:AraC-like DNA-binding protein
MLDQLQIVYPTADALQDLIYCYYIIEDTADDYRSLHYSFPHTLNAVTIYDNGIFINSGNSIKITGGRPYVPFCLLQGKRLSPLLVDLEGKLSRITILFKPLGLNYFLGQALGELLTTDTALFAEWTSPAFERTLSGLFNERNISSRLALLESFLLSIRQPVHLSAVEQVINHMATSGEDRSMEYIAGLMHMSVRTLNRHFRAHTGVSPVVYRQILRFRSSISDKLLEGNGKMLTEIGYRGHFYDQSYFTKFYKQLSGLNPRRFFRSIEHVAGSDLVFQFVCDKIG